MRRSARSLTTPRFARNATDEEALECRPAAPADSLAGLIELLERGRDGHPRAVVVWRRDEPSVQRLARRVMADGRARGFLALSVQTYSRMKRVGGEDLQDRTLLLVAPPDVSDREGALALISASAHSPRAHVLLLLRAARASDTPMLREARARYGARLVTRDPRTRRSEADLELYRARAVRATALVRSGRHAAAARLLREVAESFRRRDSPEDLSRTLVTLGRLLLERGRAGVAERLFDEAALAVQDGPDDELHLDARIWQMHARVDAGELTQAEALCRAVLAGERLSPTWQVRTRAALARVLLWQRRLREAWSLDLRLPVGHALDAESQRFVDATRVRLLLSESRIFEAGQLARVMLDTATDDPMARLVAETAHLRVLALSGDLHLARECVTRIVDLARRARAPFRAVKARLILAAALDRAASPAASNERQRLRRLSRAAPGLLRQLLDHDQVTQAGSEAGAHNETRTHPGVGVQLVTLAQETDEDADAVRLVLTRTREGLRAGRIDVWSAEAGPASVVVSEGTGLRTRLGERVLHAGISIGPESAELGVEIGTPIRRGRRIAGALVARWAADQPVPPDAGSILEIAAAVICPRLEGLQTSIRHAGQTALAIPELVGTSQALCDVRAAISRAASAPFAVLLQGESGVGKELAARAIHQLSARRERGFCDINCAALPDDLLDSELFGHARGAFTGAVAERPGLFESAGGGTVFLDEVADLSLRAQAKLLRVLQQQEVRRVGETFSRRIDVRLVTAANRDLSEEAAAGRFRSDLLYRLDVIRIRIPPLRERPEDVVPLALHFWQASALRVGTTATLSHGVLSSLSRYHWRGNVRELQNVIAALAVAAPSRGQVRAHLLPAAITGATAVTSARLADARAQFEKRFLESALARNNGNRSRAAREVGLSRQGLLKMMERLGK